MEFWVWRNLWTAEELESTLRTFLDRCKKHGVTLSRKKFKCSTMINYGGHMLDTQGEDLMVRPDPDKLERLRSFQVQKSQQMYSL